MTNEFNQLIKDELLNEDLPNEYVHNEDLLADDSVNINIVNDDTNSINELLIKNNDYNSINNYYYNDQITNTTDLLENIDKIKIIQSSKLLYSLSNGI